MAHTAQERYYHTPQGDVGFCDVDFKTQLTTIMITPRKGT